MMDVVLPARLSGLYLIILRRETIIVVIQIVISQLSYFLTRLPQYFLTLLSLSIQKIASSTLSIGLFFILFRGFAGLLTRLI